MSRVVLVTTSPDLEREVLAATAGDVTSLRLWPLPAEPWDVLSHLNQQTAPEVLILDSGVTPELALELASRFDEQYPFISVVLVSESAEEIVIPAMRAGVRDLIHPAADASEIRLILERAAKVATSRSAPAAASQPAPSTSAPVRHGTVISVTSPKGGVGKTTVATNLAIGLAQSAPNSTVIVDLDVQFGDVASALNLSPEYTLPEAIQPGVRQDSMVLKTFLTLHSTGLYAICGSPSPEAADSITPEGVDELLTTLAQEFRWVVVDTAPGLTPHTLAALDHSSALVLVASMDVPAVRGLRKELDTLQDLGIFGDHRTIVLNFVDSRGGLTVGDIEKAISAKVDVILPRSKVVTASVNQGIPLLQANTRDPITKQLRLLVDRFSPQASSPSRWRRRGRHRGAEEAAAS